MDTKLFDVWNVQLAKTYKPGMIKPDTWFSISEKINGVRATAFAGRLISRTGHEILGFDNILKDLRGLKVRFPDYVFDGELRLHTAFSSKMSDNEIFKETVGIVNSQKDFSQKYKVQFIIFDVIPRKDFSFEQPTIKYAERLRLLKEIEEFIDKESIFSLRIVPIYYTGRDINMIEEYSKFAYENGKEGIMINLDNTYDYKRSSKLLKYKQFNTIDLEVLGYQEGTGKYDGMLGALLCKYKNNIVAVGSGFTDDQRYNLWKVKDKLNGSIVEVKYKDITSDKSTGLESLQFPVFLNFRRDKLEADV